MAVILGSPGIYLGGASAPPTPPPFTNTYSMSFDGVDEYLTAGNPASLQITGALTLSAWVKTTNTTTTGIIVGKDGVSTGTRSYQIQHASTGEARFVIFKSTGIQLVQSTSQINDGNWHHIMGVNDGTDLKIYVNGTLENTTVGGGGTILNGTSYFAIGRREANAPQNILWFNGNIDEVAIWNTDQSSNVSTIYNGGAPTDLTSLSPLSWWRMGDNDTWNGSTWTLTDNGSGGNDATSVFMLEADRLPITPNSYTQNSFNFNFNSYFNLATKTQNFTDFSLSFWILSRGGNNKSLFANDSLTVANGGGILANIQDSAYRVRYFDDSTGYTNLSDTLIGSVWNHIVITYQSSTNELKGYTNNVLFTTLNPTITTLANNSHSFDKIGYSVGTNYTGSNLDEISVFDSVLNPTQISQIFGIGTPNDISSLSPVHHWRMGENATWNGSTWTITDIGSSPITLTSNGMTEAYKTGDQAYVL